MNELPDQKIEWAEQWIAIVGRATFRYYPKEMRMVFRGKDYHGIAPENIDEFVRNRMDR